MLKNTLLENELQPHLHEAWSPSPVDLAILVIDRIEARIGAGGAKRRLAAAAGVNRTPLRVVESVESLQAELEGGVFTTEPGRLEILKQGEVPVVPPRARQHVTPHIAEHARFAVGSKLRKERLGDHAGIKPCRRGAKLRIVVHPLLDFERSQGVALDTPADSTAVSAVSATEIHGHPSVETGDAAELPSSQPSPQERTRGLLEKRQVVDVIQDQHVGAVGVRCGAPPAQIGVVYAMVPGITRGGIDAVRVGVRRLEDDPVAGGMAEINLQGVVVGNCRVLVEPEVAETAKGAEVVGVVHAQGVVDQDTLHVTVAGRIAATCPRQHRHILDPNTIGNLIEVALGAQMTPQSTHPADTQKVIS